MRHRPTHGSTMEHPKQTEFTADEFIAWSLDQPTGRYELVDGVVYAMAPERVGHSIAKVDAVFALRAGIKARGLPCEVLPDGVSVRIDDKTIFEPDALVRCGPPAPRDATEATEPVIVVEVISPSSRGVDTGVKLASYFSLASVHHYLVIDIDKRFVIHYRRDEDEIAVRIVYDGTLALDPPGIELPIRDLFDNL